MVEVKPITRYHEKNRPDDAMAAIQDDEEDELNGHDQDILKLRSRNSTTVDLNLVEPVNSRRVNHASLMTVLHNLSSHILQIRQNVEAVQSEADDNIRQSSNKAGRQNEQVVQQQKARVAEVLRQQKQEKLVPIDHALVLVKHLVHLKTANLELETYIKEMQVKMAEANVAVPPKHKPENTGGDIESDESVDEGGDEDDDSSYDSEDSDAGMTSDGNLKIVPGEDLVQQILYLQNKDNAKNLGLSQRQKISKPLAKKQAPSKLA